MVVVWGGVPASGGGGWGVLRVSWGVPGSGGGMGPGPWAWCGVGLLGDGGVSCGVQGSTVTSRVCGFVSCHSFSSK